MADADSTLEQLVSGLRLGAADSPGAHSCSAPTHRHLYMDGLNYASTKFFITPNHWRVEEAYSSVREFVQAARITGWRVTVFLDASIPSTEAQRKWFSRRETEVRKGVRNVPHGVNLLLAECFRSVHFTPHTCTLEHAIVTRACVCVGGGRWLHIAHGANVSEGRMGMVSRVRSQAWCSKAQKAPAY